MDKKALFCDGTRQFISPPEPLPEDTVEFRFRTAAEDVDSVELFAEGEYYRMQKVETVGKFDYYRTFYRIGEETFRYYFRITKGDEVVYYNRFRVVDEPLGLYDFRICPGFSTPDWAKGAVMYQIFPDRFYNGDPSNDVVDNEYIYIHEPVKQIKDWEEYPKAMDVRNFHGGDLQGVWDKLDYLQDLGVEVLYFNPLFVSPSNHKYDGQDYDYIDPHLGVIVKDGGQVLEEGDMDNRNATKYRVRVTDKENLEASNRFFAQLVEEIHRRGMRVIMDGVFNHCGSFHKWLDREKIYEDAEGYAPGAYLSEKSPYKDFFMFRKEEDNDWPDNNSYEGWWGHFTLPKLNYEKSDDLVEYILRIGQKWVSEPYCVDGWRLDVASDLGHSKTYNHAFWRKFRRAVKEANPDTLILAEHYGDPREWLAGDEWDTVMNYDAFMEPLTWFLTGMEKHSDEERSDLRGHAESFVRSILHNMSCYMTPSLQTAMNELSNHDHSRFLTRTNHVVGRLGPNTSEEAEQNVNKAVMREAVVIQMTWIGAPTVYYGDEAGLCGFTDPDARRAYPWGHEDQQMLAFHKDVIAIHKKYTAFKTGSLKLLLAEGPVLAFGRFTWNQQFVIVVNCSEELKQVSVPVWLANLPWKGSMRRLLYSYNNGYTTEYEEYIIEDGEIVLNMGSYSALILKNMEY